MYTYIYIYIYIYMGSYDGDDSPSLREGRRAANKSVRPALFRAVPCGAMLRHVISFHLIASSCHLASSHVE